MYQLYVMNKLLYHMWLLCTSYYWSYYHLIVEYGKEISESGIGDGFLKSLGLGTGKWIL